METVERWWNGAWGRLSRRDVWLKTDGTMWQVEAREGGVDSPTVAWEFFCEPDARAMLTWLLEDGRGGWGQLPTGWGRRDQNR